MSEQDKSITTLEERQKQIGLWAAGIFTALSALFAGISIYAVIVMQQGRFYLEDAVLMPTTIVAVVVSILSYFLIRRGLHQVGTELLFTIMMLLPVIATLLVDNFEVIAASYIAIFAPIMFIWVLPKTSRRRAAIVIALVVSAMIGIEIWNPSFRGTSNFAANALPVVITLAAVALLAYLGRQAIMGNIQRKLITAFVGLALISVATIGIITNLVSRTEITQQAGENIHALALSQAQTVGNEITKQIELISTLKQNPVLQKTVVGTNANYTGDASAIAQTIDQLDKVWRAADAANNNADPLVQSVLSNELATYLTAFQKTFPDHIELFVTDRFGASIASTDRTSDYNQADEDWWQATYNNGIGAVYIGQPEFDASTQTYAINMAIPVQDERTGKMIGVIRTTYRLAAFQQILGNVHFGQTGVTDLIFANNELVGSDTPHESLDANTQAQLKSLTGDYAQIIFDGIPQVVSKVPVVSSDTGMKYINNLGWTLVTSQEAAEALAPVATQTQTTLFVSLGVLLVALLLGLLAAQYLAGPIIRLTAVASQVAAGDLTIQAQVTSQDETGILASTFNKMTAQLRDFIGTLESRVAERTRNLELAAEVGRTVSQVRALDVMLTDAAELIRKQFDLYYVQVYLADPGQTYLNLQAGTGRVGTELLQRNHRLPLNTDSINGRAAVEKKSVVISDTTTSATFKPNPLLPNTRSEMAVPLLIGNKVVGVLDMQSEHAGSLSQDVLPAFEALAGQLAIAIQNANLLAEAEQARAEVESQARRLTRSNWMDYLDAIHKPEETGFLFEQNKISVLTQAEETQTAENSNALVAPIAVTGEALGNLVVEMEGQSPISRTSELVNTVARQVAQQIESLRLLDSAERYRFEAEQASRRLTREGWTDYTNANADKSLSYIYDLKEVRPYNQDGDQQAEESALSLPLKVRDETVGKLVVQGLGSNDRDSIDLANAVAERLGAHIESLRLSQQTEQVARREHAMRQITSAVRGSTDPATILRAAVRELGTLLGRKTVIRLETAREAQDSRADRPADVVGEVIADDGNVSVSPAESPNADGGNE
jgi:GAF domain-containing protein/HAMP domain-containing protein